MYLRGGRENTRKTRMTANARRETIPAGAQWPLRQVLGVCRQKSKKSNRSPSAGVFTGT
jgi:hypothetical protein